MNISVSITHYNNSKFLDDVLDVIDNDDRIDEIIINDDHSNDWNLLQEKVSKLNNPKIKLHRNSENLGNFINKLKTLSLCKNEWAILLDMDNMLTKNYIDAIYKEYPWNNKYIYAPEWARTFNTRGKFIGSAPLHFHKLPKIIDKNTIKKHLTATTFRTINMECCLNVGNYFVNKTDFLRIENKAFGNYNKGKLSNVDYLQTNTEWLANDKALKILPNMIYNHRTHSDSCYMKSDKKEGKRLTLKCIKRLISLK